MYQDATKPTIDNLKSFIWNVNNHILTEFLFDISLWSYYWSSFYLDHGLAPKRPQLGPNCWQIYVYRLAYIYRLRLVLTPYPCNRKNSVYSFNFCGIQELKFALPQMLYPIGVSFMVIERVEPWNRTLSAILNDWSRIIIEMEWRLACWGPCQNSCRQLNWLLCGFDIRVNIQSLQRAFLSAGRKMSIILFGSLVAYFKLTSWSPNHNLKQHVV